MPEAPQTRIGLGGRGVYREAGESGAGKGISGILPAEFYAWLGIPISDDLFVPCAGTTELIIGQCLVFGFFPRLVIVTAWLFINMTLIIFNGFEPLDHLPLYGVIGIFLVWTPDEDDQKLWIDGVLEKSWALELHIRVPHFSFSPRLLPSPSPAKLLAVHFLSSCRQSTVVVLETCAARRLAQGVVALHSQNSAARNVP